MFQIFKHITPEEINPINKTLEDNTIKEPLDEPLEDKPLKDNI